MAIVDRVQVLGEALASPAFGLHDAETSSHTNLDWAASDHCPLNCSW